MFKLQSRKWAGNARDNEEKLKSINHPPSLQPSLKLRLSKKAMVDKALSGKLSVRT